MLQLRTGVGRLLLGVILLVVAGVHLQFAIATTDHGVRWVPYISSSKNAAPAIPSVNNMIELCSGASMVAEIDLSDTQHAASFFIQTNRAAGLSYRVKLSPSDSVQNACTCEVVMGEFGTVDQGTVDHPVFVRVGLLCTRECAEDQLKVSEFDLLFEEEKGSTPFCTVHVTKTYPNLAQQLPQSLEIRGESFGNRQLLDPVNRRVKPDYSILSGNKLDRARSSSGSDIFDIVDGELQGSLQLVDTFASDELGEIEVIPEDGTMDLSKGRQKLAIGSCVAFERESEEKSKDGSFSNYYRTDAVISLNFVLKLPDDQTTEFAITYQKTCEVTFYNFGKAAIAAAVVAVATIIGVLIYYCFWLSSHTSGRAARHRRACRTHCPRFCLYCARCMRRRRTTGSEPTQAFELDSDQEDAMLIAATEAKRGNASLAEGLAAPVAIPGNEFFKNEPRSSTDPESGLAEDRYAFRNEHGVDETTTHDRGADSVRLMTFSKSTSPGVTDVSRKSSRVETQAAARSRAESIRQAEQRGALAVMGGERGIEQAAAMGIHLSVDREERKNDLKRI